MKVKAIFLGLLVAVAFTAVATAAQAAKYSKVGAIETHTEKGTVNKLEGKPFTVSVKISCTERTIEGASIANNGEGIGTGTATLKFSKCTSEKPAGCKVEEPVVTALGSTLTGLTELAFSPQEEGKPFTTITLVKGSGSCSLEGKPFPVEGKQKCELPGATVEAVEHELVCKSSGSELTAGGAAAKFESSVAKLKLVSGEPYKTE